MLVVVRTGIENGDLSRSEQVTCWSRDPSSGPAFGRDDTAATSALRAYGDAGNEVLTGVLGVAFELCAGL